MNHRTGKRIKSRWLTRFKRYREGGYCVELSGFSYIMRDIHRLLVQLHLLSLAGQFFVVSGEISMPCSQ